MELGSKAEYQSVLALIPVLEYSCPDDII